MRHIVIGAVLLAVSPLSSAKPCEELGAEISARLEAKGVRRYTLRLVPAAEVRDETVVASCDGGATKLIYRRR